VGIEWLTYWSRRFSRRSGQEYHLVRFHLLGSPLSAGPVFARRAHLRLVMRSGVPWQLEAAEVPPPASASPWKSSCFCSSCSCSYSPWWWWWVGWRLGLRNCSCDSKRKHRVFRVASMLLASCRYWVQSECDALERKRCEQNIGERRDFKLSLADQRDIVFRGPCASNLSWVEDRALIPKKHRIVTRVLVIFPNDSWPLQVAEPTESKRYSFGLARLSFKPFWISSQDIISAVSHD